MVTTVIHKLIKLTNQFIEATEDRTAREIRDQLVADVFPTLTATMRQEIANITEYNDMLRHVGVTCRDLSPEITEATAMVLVRRMRRVERAQRDDEELMEIATSSVPERQMSP